LVTSPPKSFVTATVIGGRAKKKNMVV